MLRRYFLYFLSFIVVLAVNFLTTAPAHSQTSSQATPSVTIGNGDFKTANQEAVDKLRQMPPGKIAALDDKLAEALTLYYDGKFAQALPIFKGISADVETMDIMWWLGTSAMKAGEARLAIEKFNKMLAIDSKLYRVRLELAVAYFELRQYNEARRELEIVKQSQPPPEVLKNIDKLLGAITESTKKVTWNVRFSQGIQWDSNVSSGPDQKILSVTGGTLTLPDGATKTSDWASIENFSGNILYDFGEKNGFMWNTTADLYNQFYFNYGRYNYPPGRCHHRPVVGGPAGYRENPRGYLQAGIRQLAPVNHLSRPAQLRALFYPQFQYPGPVFPEQGKFPGHGFCRPEQYDIPL